MVDTPIGTNSPNYELQPTDVGATIFCRVTATNASGSAQAFSNAVGPVVAASGDTLPANAGGADLPAITPTTTVEGTLYTTTNGTWTGTPAPTFTRQWKSGATNVGTGLATYTTVAGDVGNNITCVVTATNTVGSANATSNSVGPVTAAGGGTSTWSTTDYATNGAAPVWTNGNLTVAGTIGSVIALRGTQSRSSGKYYFEVTLNAFTIGVNDHIYLGVADNTTLSVAVFGTGDEHGITYTCVSGEIIGQTSTAYSPTGVTAATGAVLGFACDMDGNDFWVSKNGVWTQGNPATPTGETDWGAITGAAVFPYVYITLTDAAGQVTINTGGSAFAATPPTGYSAWG